VLDCISCDIFARANIWRDNISVIRYAGVTRQSAVNSFLNVVGEPAKI